MGVVHRQSSKFSIVSYAAMMIGMVNVLLIYPFALTEEELGLLRTLISTSGLLVPFVYFGVNALTIRFFPEFKNEDKGHNGFLGLLLLISSFGYTLFVVAYFLGAKDLVLLIPNQSPLINQFLPYLLPLVLFISLFNILRSYSTNFKRIVVPGLLEHLSKIILPAAALLYYYNYITLEQTAGSLILNWFLVVLFLFIYVKNLKQLFLKPNFSFLSKDLNKRMANYAFYGILGSLGTVLATQIDVIMVSGMTTFSAAGVYTVALFISNAIDVPRNAIHRITSPLVSEAWHAKDLPQIKKLYQTSSLNLIIIEIFLFLGIWVCIDDLYSIMPNGEKYIIGKYVVLILGLTRLLDAVTSINDTIIGYSKYFRFNFYAILFLAVFNIICNLIFIEEFQIMGAALATMSSILLFNILKLSFIKWRFNLLPFTRNTFYVILLAFLSYGIIYFIPSTGNPFINIIIKGLMVTFTFMFPIIYFQLSEELNKFLRANFEKIFKRKFPF